MPEWWTYSLSDFLMFSPQAYWRLVARYNLAWWPAQVAGVLGPAGLALLLRRGSAVGDRLALVLLAVGWAWVGWAFHWKRYSEIFLAAPWVAGGCALQALLLVVAAAWLAALQRGHAPDGGRRLPQPAKPGASVPGALLLLAAGFYPLLAPLEGRALAEAEVFGSMPEPTALATLAALTMLRAAPRWLCVLLAILPLLSLLLGAATRWLLAQ